jgi:hypothetical protein
VHTGELAIGVIAQRSIQRAEEILAFYAVNESRAPDEQ